MHTRSIYYSVNYRTIYKRIRYLRIVLCTRVEDRSFVHDIRVKRYVHRIHSSENRRRTDEIEANRFWRQNTADETREYIRYTYKCCDHRVVSNFLYRNTVSLVLRLIFTPSPQVNGLVPELEREINHGTVKTQAYLATRISYRDKRIYWLCSGLASERDAATWCSDKGD